MKIIVTRPLPSPSQATMLKKIKMKRRNTEPNIVSASTDGAKSSND